jgi:hypothetical protein
MHATLVPVVQIATLGTLFTGLVSLVVWARIYRRQVNAQILIEITARYATTFQSFPAQLWLAQLDPDQPLPERRPEFTVRAFEYSTIVVFAYLLHERRFLTNDVWAILQAEHRQTIASPWFVREWNVIKGQFEMYPNFIGYVERLLRRQSR